MLKEERQKNHYDNESDTFSLTCDINFVIAFVFGFVRSFRHAHEIEPISDTTGIT